MNSGNFINLSFDCDELLLKKKNRQFKYIFWTANYGKKIKKTKCI